MKSKAGKIFVTILGILMMLYFGLVLGNNIWDKISARDGFGLVQYVFLISWSMVVFLPFIRHDTSRKNWAGVILLAGLFLIKLPEYFITKDLSDLGIALTVAIIGAIYAYRKRTNLFQKTFSQAGKSVE